MPHIKREKIKKDIDISQGVHFGFKGNTAYRF